MFLEVTSHKDKKYCVNYSLVTDFGPAEIMGGTGSYYTTSRASTYYIKESYEYIKGMVLRGRPYRTAAISIKDLPSKIRIFRKARKLNQAAFAKIIGVTRICVSMWENGRSTPRPATLKAIISCLPGIIGKEQA